MVFILWCRATGRSDFLAATVSCKYGGFGAVYGFPWLGRSWPSIDDTFEVLPLRIDSNCSPIADTFVVLPPFLLDVVVLSLLIIDLNNVDLFGVITGLVDSSLSITAGDVAFVAWFANALLIDV